MRGFRASFTLSWRLHSTGDALEGTVIHFAYTEHVTEYIFSLFPTSSKAAKGAKPLKTLSIARSIQ